MPRICISYRRSDSDGITGRIFDRLVSHYGKDSIFRDIDNVPAGIDFRELVKKTLQTTNVLLAVVGPKWIGPRRGGPPRIIEETDLVRIEVATALTSGILVIPVLVGDTRMPSEQLPPSIKEFAFRNAMRVDPGVDFDQHMQRLIRSIDGLLMEQVKLSPEAAPGLPTEKTTLITSPPDDLAKKAETPPVTLPDHERKAKRLSLRWYWGRATIYLVFAAAVLIIGGIFLLQWHYQTIAQLRTQYEMQTAALKQEFADRLAMMQGLTPSDLKRLGESVTYIKNEWYLHDHTTRRLLYHRVVQINGENLPCFVQVNNGTFVRWLTLDDQGGMNKPVGVNQAGTGFVVSEVGFIVTNKRYAAGWMIPYEDSPQSGPWRGAVYMQSKPDQQPTVSDLRTLDKNNSLANWLPVNGGYVFESSRPSLISTEIRDFFGQNDLLTVQFPGTRINIIGSLQRAATAGVDLAVVKIDAATEVSKQELADVDTWQIGDKVFLFSYEASQPRILESPIVTEGVIAKLGSRDGDNMEIQTSSLPRTGGGPVLNARGKVIGVLLDPGGIVRGAAAVPISNAREVFQPQRNAAP